MAISPLIVNTPKFGRKNFTGKTHMPTPTKAMIFNNVNLINNAKWAYGMIKNVNPNVEMIVSMDIQMTASIEYADLALPANSWLEFEGLEITASCSNPFLQIWKGGIPPVFDSKDDLDIIAGIANALAKAHRRQTLQRLFRLCRAGKAPRLYSAACSTPARPPRVTSSPTSWPASTALRAAAC